MEVKAEERGRLDSVTGEGVTWINIEKPSRREIDILAQIYPFHPLDLDDCLSKIQLPKIDEYEDYLFIILHFPRFIKQARITLSSQVSIFLGRNYLVTVHQGDLKPLTEMFQACKNDGHKRDQLLGRDSGYLLYRIIDGLVDYLFPILDKVMGNLEMIEDKVFDDKTDAARDVSIVRRDIATQRRIIFPLRRVIIDLERKAQRFTKDDLSVYFSDVTDHINRIWEALEECKEAIEIYKDTDFMLSTDRTNRILAVLTIIFTILLPFMVVSGIYGMNVPLPGQGSFITFLLLLFLMMLPAAGMVYFFHHRRWI